MIEEHALFQAVINEDLPMIEVLLNFFYADINKLNENGDTLLHHAIEYEKIKIIEILINKGADINKPNNYGETPLVIAIQRKNPTIVELLIKKGVDINKQVNEDNRDKSPLSYAFSDNYFNQKNIELLIKKGAIFNKRENDKISPLHLATTYNRPIIIEALLKMGADIDTLDNNGNTPLLLAVMYSYPDTVAFLLKNGANPYIKDKYGKTVLDYSIKLNPLYDEHKEIIDLINQSTKFIEK